MTVRRAVQSTIGPGGRMMPTSAMIDLPPMTPPLKRSVTIEGHRTSVSLEDAFWRALLYEAEQRGMTRATLIGRIDRNRPPDIGLATALRLFVLSEMDKRGG
ncbi:Ribbon-helix-helix domain-containing protein [Paracoccus saliphilus]|uniref:Ribbon-helix-helix domain-containing protein n=3 Tax=Paracoccus saliphilus TaxID=405559 RepID=A0AA45W118_9RHOB|nr:Ribbon-helix-helix domain-containing protein [Paracoccus saliphilus]